MKLSRIIVVFSIALLSTTWTFGQKAKPYSESDNNARSLIREIKGKVTVINDPTYGKILMGKVFLAFQRVGCDECLTATYSDAEGNYKIFLSVGKYKLIAQHKNCGAAPVTDCEGENYLASDQEQYVVVKADTTHDKPFDIDLVWPYRKD